MITAFLSLLAILLSFQLFTITSKLTAINRIVISTPIAIFEASIPLISEEEKATLHFDQKLLEESLFKYYANALDRYAKVVDLDFYYYHQGDQSYCVDDKCNAVEVQVSATIVFDFQYHRVMFYEIKETGYGH